MHRTICCSAVGFSLLILTFPAALSAQNTAVTHPKNADADFAIQGEYSGRIVENSTSGWKSSKYGLQVVAQGGGEFLAVLYPGGLPGSGWNREHKFALSGKRDAETLELSGDELRVILKDGKARLASAERQLVGELAKVHRESPTLGKRPPSNAVVLFDGKETEYLKGARISEDGLLMEGVELTKLAQDFQLHLEFRLPYMPYARGQARANSGVYLHKRYEVQVLDSFGLEGAFNEAGSLYREHKPILNMCLPPLQWQTYDIAFTAPRFDADGNKTKNAKLTVLLNGVPVQKNLELASATGGGKRVGEGPNPLPINLQNHGNPVRFRNIWMVDFTTEPAETQNPQTPKPPAPITENRPATPGTGVRITNRRVAGLPQTLFPGGMIPAGVVPYYVPGYYAAPQAAPTVWGW